MLRAALPFLLALSLASEAHQLNNKRASVVLAEERWTPQDVEAEVFFGRNMAAKMLGQYQLYDDEQVQGYLNHLGSSLARYSDRPELDYFFGVLDSEKLNAFATPGGYIFITKGALMQCESEAELAGILAHEIGHISHRHIVKQLNIRGKKADDFSGFMSSIIAGGGQSTTSAFKLAMDEALDVWHGRGLKSREDEYEADLVATQILTRAGYSVDGFANFLSRVALLKSETSDRVRTHPPFLERVKRINQNHNLVKMPEDFGKQRFEGYLMSLMTFKRDKENILRQLASTPIVPDQTFQKYLNQITQVVQQTTGLPESTLVAVESKEIIFESYSQFSLISTALLNRLETEAELASLVLFKGFANQQADSFDASLMDYRVAAALTGIDYSPMAWSDLLARELGDWSKDSAQRIILLKQNFAESDHNQFQMARWRSQVQNMNQTRDDLSVHPLFTWVEQEAEEEAVRYLNLMAFALVKHLQEAGESVSLKGVMVTNDRFHYARMQDNYLVISQMLRVLEKEEALVAAMMVNAILVDFYRDQMPDASLAEIHHKADLKTTGYLKSFGYGDESMLDYLVAFRGVRPFIDSETFYDRAAALSDEMNISMAEIEAKKNMKLRLVSVGEPEDFYQVKQKLNSESMRKFYSNLKVDSRNWIWDLEFKEINDLNYGTSSEVR